MDLDLKFDAANNEDGRRRVAFLMKYIKSYAHPDYPQKKEMRMYRVLLSMIDGQRKATQHLTDLKVEGAIKDPAAASLLMEKHEKDEALVTSFELGDTEKDAGSASADKKRHKKGADARARRSKKGENRKGQENCFHEEAHQGNRDQQVQGGVNNCKVDRVAGIRPKWYHSSDCYSAIIPRTFA